MVTVAELKRDLEVTEEDREEARKGITQEERMTGGDIRTPIPSKYVFKCNCCAQMGGINPLYRLIKEDRGRKTDTGKIETTHGIMLLNDLESKPENSSTLNITRDGPTCDHCYDSVYSGE